MNKLLNNFVFRKRYLRIILRSIFGEPDFASIISGLEINLNTAFAAADYGAGVGFLTLNLAAIPKCRIVYSLDCDEISLDSIAVKAKQMETLHKIEFIETDLAKNLKMKNDSVDYAFCSYLLSYNDASSALKILNGIAAVMNIGAGLYISEFISSSALSKFEVPFALPQKKMIELIENTGKFSIQKNILKKYTQTFFLKKIKS